MRKIISKHKILILIILLSAFLRFYRLGDYPSLNADEAAIGYNVYSLLETGKDEHGAKWPVHFQSFNDYKPGGYFYMVMPFVYLFGLSVWSVRFIGALMGVGSVFALYLLVREITKEEKIALISSFLLSIIPWHLHFSRGGWEVNAATFFIVSGVYLFYKGVKNGKYFALSVICFVISLYTYHAARVLVPMIGISLLLIHYKNIFTKQNAKLFLGSILLGGVLLVPLAVDFVGEAGRSRASGVSIFADRGYIDRINENRGNYENPNSPAARLIHNKPKEIILEFSKNYFEHFWGEFLFLSGDEIQRNKVPETGQLYIFQSVLLVSALISIFKNPKRWWFILVWLAIAPVPAALTFQSPHALRAQNMAIPLAIISGYGLYSLFDFMKVKFPKNKQILMAFYILISGVILWEMGRYLHQYYVHMAETYPYSSQYGIPEMVEYVNENKDKYDKVVITSRYDQPYILYLFFSVVAGDKTYSPERFQNNHQLSGRDEFGFSTVPYFDKFVFKPIDFENDRLIFNNSLILGTDEEILDEANVVKEIYGSNGFLYFQAVAN